MRLQFISDLHLSPERPQHIHLFCHLINQLEPQQERLYILGDLFEFWLGDDAILPEYQLVIDAFKEATDKGCRIAIMHGNRDFLLGKHFIDISGCELIDDPTLIEVNGKPLLLSHGDKLCTDDTEYQRYRSYLRKPEVQQEFLAQTPAERQKIVMEHRLESQKKCTDKAEMIMDVNPQAVIDLMTKYNVDTLIHGHTHRPARHQLVIKGRPAERIVLPDWGQYGYLLTSSGNDFLSKRLDGTTSTTTIASDVNGDARS